MQSALIPAFLMRRGKQLHKGQFAQLKQFGRHPAYFVLPDVVVMEMKRHLTENLKLLKYRFTPRLADAWEALGLKRDQVDTLLDQLAQRPGLDVLCEEQFTAFLTSSAALVLTAEDYVPMAELVRTYFGGMPPFEEKNPKKSEFPDAIALLTLDAWAEKEDRHVLVVSKDKDWQRFCNSVERLHCVTDLPTALDLLQTPDAVVTTMLQRIFDELQDPDKHLHIMLSEDVFELDWGEHIKVETSSQFEFEEDEIYVRNVTDIFFPSTSEQIKLTEKNDETITVTFRVQAKIEFIVHYSFRKWDGVDSDYVEMGKGSASDNVAGFVDVTLFLPIANGAFNDVSIRMEIEGMWVHFDDVEPDWMSSGGCEE